MNHKQIRALQKLKTYSRRLTAEQVSAFERQIYAGDIEKFNEEFDKVVKGIGR